MKLIVFVDRSCVKKMLRCPNCFGGVNETYVFGLPKVERGRVFDTTDLERNGHNVCLFKGYGTSCILLAVFTGGSRRSE